MNNLKSFISGTSDVVFSIFFCSNIAALKTSFWACPLKTDHIKLNACDVYSLEAHLEVYFSGCLPEETFIDAHQKLHFRNIGLHLLNPLLLEHRHLEDVFLGTPSEDRQNKTEYMWRILSRSSFGSFFPAAAFLKKRISTLITAGKQYKGSKGKADICLCSSC